MAMGPFLIIATVFFFAIAQLADAHSAAANQQKGRLDPDDFPAAYLFSAFAKAKLGKVDEAEQRGLVCGLITSMAFRS